MPIFVQNTDIQSLASYRIDGKYISQFCPNHILLCEYITLNQGKSTYFVWICRIPDYFCQFSLQNVQNLTKITRNVTTHTAPHTKLQSSQIILLTDCPMFYWLCADPVRLYSSRHTQTADCVRSAGIKQTRVKKQTSKELN